MGDEKRSPGTGRRRGDQASLSPSRHDSVSEQRRLLGVSAFLRGGVENGPWCEDSVAFYYE